MNSFSISRNEITFMLVFDWLIGVLGVWFLIQFSAYAPYSFFPFGVSLFVLAEILAIYGEGLVSVILRDDSVVIRLQDRERSSSLVICVKEIESCNWLGHLLLRDGRVVRTGIAYYPYRAEVVKRIRVAINADKDR